MYLDCSECQITSSVHEIASSEHVVYTNCFLFWHSEQSRYTTCSQHIVSFWQKFTCTIATVYLSTSQVTGESPKKGLIMHNVFVTEVTQYCVHGGLQQIKGSLTKNLIYKGSFNNYVNTILPFFDPPPSEWVVFTSWAWTKTDIFWPPPPLIMSM